MNCSVRCENEEENLYLRVKRCAMKDMFERFEFSGPSKITIKEINGVRLPEDYLAFVQAHGGGEGEYGKNAYIQLFSADELEQINDEYEVASYMDRYFIWGTDLGGMMFGYSGKTGLYSAADACSLREKDLMYEEKTLAEFLERWDRELEE